MEKQKAAKAVSCSLSQRGDTLGAIRPGFSKTFTICDADDQLSITKGACRRMGLYDKALPR